MVTNNIIKNEFDFAIHPGRILLKYLKVLNMTQTKLAAMMGVKKTVINEMIHGKRAFTISFALKLEPIFDMPATYWCNMQNMYDATLKKLLNNKQTSSCIKETEEINSKLNCIELQVKSQTIFSAV